MSDFKSMKLEFYKSRNLQIRDRIIYFFFDIKYGFQIENRTYRFNTKSRQR